MKRIKIETAYIGLSLAILVAAKPGHDVFSDWAILLSGTAGSLLLAFDCIWDIFYIDLTLGWQFCSESFIVFIFALLLWVAGLLTLLQRNKIRKKVFRVITIAILWTIGSFYNLVWFGIRGL